MSVLIGQFHHGEFHGYGLLNNELDGSQYEGEWSYNKRQGTYAHIIWVVLLGKDTCNYMHVYTCAYMYM